MLAIWFTAVVAVLAAALPLEAKPFPAVIGAHVDELKGGAKVVLDLSEPVRFEIFTLPDPFRVVIDLEQVRWVPSRRTLPVDRDLVKRLRYGLFRPGLSRVVLDCNHAAAVGEAAVVRRRDGGGYRLVVELVDVPADTFITTMATLPTAVAAIQPMGRAVAPSHRVPRVDGGPETNETDIRSAPGLRSAGLVVLPPSRKPSSAPGKRVVVIDPGHGGVDPGAISRAGVYEKTVTLAAARLVREELRKLGRYNVVLTRDGDRFIRLRERVAFARAADADLFISVHADANPVSTVRGASVYTLSEKASDAEAAALAERENKADLIVGVNLAREAPEVATILIDLAQRETMNNSARFAASVIDELGQRTALLGNTHRFAGFAVLKAPDVPSVLVEIGHLSNPRDEKLLQQDGYLRKLAQAIARAVDRYFAAAEQARRH